jgi:hypothetical protein
VAIQRLFGSLYPCQVFEPQFVPHPRKIAAPMGRVGDHAAVLRTLIPRGVTN